MEKALNFFRTYACEIAAVLIIGTHFLFIISFFEPAFSTPDANGYFKQGQLIADHGRTWFQDESPIQYINIQWMEVEGNRLYSRYPPGLPVMIALLYKIFGPDAGTFVNVILTSLTLFGLFLLCRICMGSGWALVATTVMACNPIINYGVVMNFSHAPVAFFLIWGLFFLARWSTTPSLGAAFFAGLFLGCIPTIRYAEALLGLGIGLFILLHLYENKKAWPSVVAAVIGAAIPILGLMVHNHIAFGAVWKTAYSLTNEQTGFSVDYISRNIGPYLNDILFFGAGLLSIFCLGGLGLLCANNDTRKHGILLVLLILPTTILYMAYYFRLETNPFSTMRFLLPTFYIYAIAGVWGLKIISQRWQKAAASMVGLLLVVNTLWGIPQALVSMIMVKDANASLTKVETVVRDHVTPGSLIIAPEHIQQYMDYQGCWRLVDNDVLDGLSDNFKYLVQSRYKVVNGRIEGLRPVQKSTRSKSEAGTLMAMVYHVKRKLDMREFMPSIEGELSQKLFIELDRLTPNDQTIYVIGSIEKMKQKVPPDDRLSVVKAIEPPPILYYKVKGMIPHHPEHLDLLRARLWNGLFFLDEFVVTPLGIVELIHRDGGLELIEWERRKD